jgi:hypothetical protein
VSSPINNTAFVAIKMGRRSGSAYGRQPKEIVWSAHDEGRARVPARREPVDHSGHSVALDRVCRRLRERRIARTRSLPGLGPADAGRKPCYLWDRTHKKRNPLL